MKPYNEYTLSNGLRIIHEESPTDTVYCGLFVNAGTRHEEEADVGLAHFCEHTSFKGTERRRVWHIRNGLELVGGDLNAYTNKEATVFHASVGRADFARAADLLFDIVFHSIYPQAELERETEVIIDEIDSYNDSPAELIFDEFEEMIFRGHALGRSILGTAERLRTYRTEDALRFVRRNYCPSNVTFFVYGRVDFRRVVALAEKYTGQLSAGNPCRQHLPLPAYQPEERRARHNTHQAHVMLGQRGYSSEDPRRTALFLLNNILGGPGMNSMLNVQLREKSGLVYTAESTAFCYTDTGVWSVYFGCDEQDVGRCRDLVLRQLRRLREHPLSRVQVKRAQKQLIGQIRIAGDSLESYALAMGKTYAQTGRHRDVDSICQDLQRLTPDDLQAVAQDLFQEDQLTTLVYH